MRLSLAAMTVSFAASTLLLSSSPVFAMGAPVGGPTVHYTSIQGQLGEVIVNPYQVAPLTAVIKNGGYQLLSATVRIVPKKDGQEIKNKVSKAQLMTHGGIPVLGLYPDYRNTVEVTYERLFNGKKETKSETYHLYVGPVRFISSGTATEDRNIMKAKVKKSNPAFGDRLYFLSNMGNETGLDAHAIWNNPMGGALTWSFTPQIAIFDTKGEIRWFLDAEKMWNPRNPYEAGVMMGFRQNTDGAITWGYGQHYVKYDIMGRQIWNRPLPFQYNDFSHSLDAAQNGHYFLRVASSDLRRPDATNNFGDVTGTGAGRNWAHVNSVDYDPTDDSIVISSCHQSAVVKIGHDHQVKWILAAEKGWRSPWKEKLLQPVDKDGNPIKCETNGACEGGFDFTWTQQMAFRIDSKSDKNVFYLSAFDNGDARRMEQPAMPSMKYSRAVIYKIDQKKMTVQ